MEITKKQQRFSAKQFQQICRDIAILKDKFQKYLVFATEEETKQATEWLFDRWEIITDEDVDIKDYLSEVGILRIPSHSKGYIPVMCHVYTEEEQKIAKGEIVKEISINMATGVIYICSQDWVNEYNTTVEIVKKAGFASVAIENPIITLSQIKETLAA